MKNVLFVMKLSDSEKQMLEKLDGYRFTFAENWDLPQEVMAETEIIIGNPKLSLIEQFPKLEWLQLQSAGANSYVSIPENIMLTNAYDVFGEAISEHMLACAFMSAKCFPAYIEQQKERNWKKYAEARGIFGSRVLSVGMGSIGTAFARKMALLGAVCDGVRRTVHDKPDFINELYSFDKLAEIIPEYDFVGLSLPETEETIRMYDEKILSLMKDGSTLINVGRGSAIDQDALIRLAKAGKFRAVCLDVTEPEPLPVNDPLWNTPGIYITPHISGGSSSDIIRGTLLKVVSENLARVASGRQPVHVVDRKLGY